jgi:spoIIIJ-associated protein
VSDEISVEATGETVGEAKWAAVRELERFAPGVDREQVRFQVVSEGERGLLGVGFTPAHVIATAPTPPAAPPGPASPPLARTPPAGISPEASLAYELLTRAADAIGVRADVQIDDADDRVVATFVGDDLGLLIGRHGQTIDGLQYLANAIAHRAAGDEFRRRVTVDAAGYRSRREATLESLARRAAERASATGLRVDLDPMTAVERKVVHEVLKDDPEVETASEGTEPNRFVVILPRRPV